MFIFQAYEDPEKAEAAKTEGNKVTYFLFIFEEKKRLICYLCFDIIYVQLFQEGKYPEVNRKKKSIIIVNIEILLFFKKGDEAIRRSDKTRAKKRRTLRTN